MNLCHCLYITNYRPKTPDMKTDNWVTATGISGMGIWSLQSPTTPQSVATYFEFSSLERRQNSIRIFELLIG